jgi:hypothetical protein
MKHVEKLLHGAVGQIQVRDCAADAAESGGDARYYWEVRSHRANDNLQASMVQLRLEGSNMRPQACMTLA